jgi:hypothetical protein
MLTNIAGKLTSCRQELNRMQQFTPQRTLPD